MLPGAGARAATRAASIVLALVAAAGCASAPSPPASLLVGVSQQGAVPIASADGRPLLSAAYLVRRDGSVTIVDNYGDAPAERATRTSAATATRLMALLQSPAWQSLAERPASPPNPDDVQVTVETEGKSVTRGSSGQEPIFREVLSTLAEIRRTGG